MHANFLNSDFWQKAKENYPAILQVDPIALDAVDTLQPEQHLLYDLVTSHY